MDHFTFKLRELPLNAPLSQKRVADFLTAHGLRYDGSLQKYFGVFRGEELVGGAGYCGDIIKCAAVDPAYQGEGILEALVSHIRTQLHSAGVFNSFVFTRPGNLQLFRQLGYAAIGQTGSVLLMESDRQAFPAYLSALAQYKGAGRTGAVVMNCNPFTLGHQYLIETAAAACGRLVVFAVQEDKSIFPFEDRLRLMREGTAHLPNVSVVPGGVYIISSATFPTYFLKEEADANDAYTQLDLTIFGRHICPAAGITVRFAGEEPTCPVTAKYNAAMLAHLPALGVEVEVIPRKAVDGRAISASLVRSYLAHGDTQAAQALVPPTTWAYLTSEKAAPVLESIKNTCIR